MPHACPVVSVVIPSYNHGHLIARTLDSVFAQTYSRFEVIVVDNNSSDNTDEVLARYTGDNISILKVDNHGSIAYSRNRGVDVARGEWIAFLDSDDWWTADKLLTCLRHSHNFDLIYHSLILADSSTKPLYPKRLSSWPLNQPVFTNLLLNGNPIATSSVVVRRSFLNQIGGFDEANEIIASEDYDAWLRISRLTSRFLFVRKPLGFYHFSPSSASRKDMSLSMRAVYSKYSHYLSSHEFKSMDSNAAYAAGRYAYKFGSVRVSFFELSKSILYGRFEIRVKSALLIPGLLFKLFLSLLGRSKTSS